MPNKKSGKNRSVKTLGDVTLNDFANSQVCKNRPKKANDNVNNALKALEDNKTWEEKVDELDESDFVPEIDEEGNVTYVIKKVEPRRRKKTVSASDEAKADSGNEYPIDIWFLISEFICPESVGRFAAICKSSFEVTCTAKFWFNLYKRYYVSVPGMREELQPERLVRKYGLRTNVIRALHQMYPPFYRRYSSMLSTVGEHPDNLKNRICQYHWYKRIRTKDCWVFYIKLKEKTNAQLPHSKRNTIHLPDLLEILDDVSANPDEHCRVFQVVCKHFTQVPPVLGQVLMSVDVTLSEGFINHRLQFNFGSGVSHTNITSVILDPVMNYQILDWWHPLYPHNHKIQDLIQQE